MRTILEIFPKDFFLIDFMIFLRIFRCHFQRNFWEIFIGLLARILWHIFRGYLETFSIIFGAAKTFSSDFFLIFWQIFRVYFFEDLLGIFFRNFFWRLLRSFFPRSFFDFLANFWEIFRAILPNIFRTFRGLILRTFWGIFSQRILLRIFDFFKKILDTCRISKTLFAKKILIFFLGFLKGFWIIIIKNSFQISNLWILNFVLNQRLKTFKYFFFKSLKNPRFGAFKYFSKII